MTSVAVVRPKHGFIALDALPEYQPLFLPGDLSDTHSVVAMSFTRYPQSK